MWRTLIRVMTVNGYKDEVGVVIPGWNSNLTVQIPMHRIPLELRKQLTKDFRCFAKVNIGAEDWKDLKFEDWEHDGKFYKEAEAPEPIKRDKIIYEWPKGQTRFEGLDDED